MLEKNDQRKVLGLIGFPLSHSFSEKYFADKFRDEGILDYTYRNFPLAEIGAFVPLVNSEPGMIGLNVTIPYKEQILPYLDELEDEAKIVGAVNTLRISRRHGELHLKGFNTDVYGFRESLIPLMHGQYRHALVLGTGGASKAVCYVLRELGIGYTYVSRKPGRGQLHYRDLCLSVIKNTTLIINTTPLGTYPDVSSFPDIPYDILTPDHLLYDLVYNPAESTFLRMGREKGARTKNGYEMLELQADRSWEIWTEGS